MRVVEVNGRNVVVGYIYPLVELAVGQQWAQADGSDRVVTIREIEGSIIRYCEHANDTLYEKENFEFQTRYLRVVD
jgi:hypothetical protein